MVAIWRVEPGPDGKPIIRLFRQTQEFPTCDLLESVRLLQANLAGVGQTDPVTGGVKQ